MIIIAAQKKAITWAPCSPHNSLEEQLLDWQEFGGHTVESCETVPIAQIRRRAVWEPKKLDTLRKGVAEGRPLKPVVLWDMDDGTFDFVDGIHRTELARLEGLDSVQALVKRFVKQPPAETRSAMRTAAALPPKPKDFTGSDEDWALVNQAPPPTSEIEENPVAERGNADAEFSPDEWTYLGETPAPAQPAPPPAPAPPEPEHAPDVVAPDYGEEMLSRPDEWQFIGETPPPAPHPEEAPKPEPEPGEEGYEELAPPGFLGKVVPEEKDEPVDPKELFNVVIPPETPEEKRNRTLNVREKIFYSLNTGAPLKISYETLPDRMRRVFRSTRTVEPDHVYYAGTNRHILVCWDRLRNGWRSFVVDRIGKADIEE